MAGGRNWWSARAPDDWPVMVSELSDDERVRHMGAHHGASYLEHVDFCAAIREGTRPTVTVDDGLWSVAMGAAAHRSIDEGRPVLMSEMGLPRRPLRLSPRGRAARGPWGDR